MKNLNYLKASVLYNANHNLTKDELCGLEVMTDLQDFLYNNGNKDNEIPDIMENKYKYKEIKYSLSEFYKSKIIINEDQSLDRSNYDRCKTIYNFCVDMYPIYADILNFPGAHLPDSFEEYMDTYYMVENITPSGLVIIENTICTVLNQLIANMYECVSKYKLGKELILPVSSIDEYMELSYEILGKYLLHEVKVYKESINVDKDKMYIQNLLKCVNYYINLKGSELVEWCDIKLKIQKYKNQPKELVSSLKEFIEDRWDDIQYTFNAVIKLSPATCIKEVNTLNELILVVSATDNLRELNPILKPLIGALVSSDDEDERSVVLIYQESLRKREEMRQKIEYMGRPFKLVRRRGY